MGFTDEQPAAALVALLLDRTARLDERDDAAMDLSAFDLPEVVAALLEVASDPAEDELVVSSAAESLGEIWQRLGVFPPEALARLRPEAVIEVRAWMSGRARGRQDG